MAPHGSEVLVGGLLLEGARARAKAVLEAARKGRDPKAEERKRRDDTVGAVAGDYIREHVPTRREAAQRKFAALLEAAVTDA